jgi:hypothetical protein
VSSQSDDRYDFGRLVAINNAKISNALTKADKDPIPWNSVVSANMLIPRDAGPLLLNDQYVVFASRMDEHLYLVPRAANTLDCNNPEQSIVDCAAVRSLKLSERDPYSLASFSKGKYFIASYLMSDKLELIGLGNTGAKDLLSLKQISGENLLKIAAGDKAVKKVRLITRQVRITDPDDDTKARVYVLMEKYSSKSSVNINSKAALVLSFLVKDLISKPVLAKTDIEFMDLKELYDIDGAQDIYVTKDNIYLLARVPEQLYKIDLVKKDEFVYKPMCSGATSLAVENGHIFIPCFSDNKVISLAMSSFLITKESGYLGRGPAMVVPNQANQRIFVSINNDGIVAILDYDLKPLGHLFKRAAKNSMGS